MFSDVRSFTSISERLKPNEVVESLNKYFSSMVEIIMGNDGIVDKYIGDAIMAIYGAPVQHENDALQATLSGLEMLDALKNFNQEQEEHGRPKFAIGIGINFGLVTVGNIGSDRKMDYTVIGDMVNLSSRLEGLTKKYKLPLLVSESVYRKIEGHLPCRLVDRVVVKGKTQGIGIYAPKRNLTEEEKRAWEIHDLAVEAFYKRNFLRAAGLFYEVKEYLPEDYCSNMFLQRSEEYITDPPPENWTGLTVMTEK